MRLLLLPITDFQYPFCAIYHYSLLLLLQYADAFCFFRQSTAWEQNREQVRCIPAERRWWTSSQARRSTTDPTPAALTTIDQSTMLMLRTCQSAGVRSRTRAQAMLGIAVLRALKWTKLWLTDYTLEYLLKWYHLYALRLPNALDTTLQTDQREFCLWVILRDNRR